MQRIDSHPMTLVDLIRHGMPVGGRRYRGHLDDPLSEQGWQQMWDAVADAHPWDVIVTSPLQRCRAFAEALATRHGLPLEVEEGFREISFGAWEGRHVRTILEETPEQIEAYWRDPVANTPPGGEALEAFRDRLIVAWRRVTADHTGRHILMVTHGGVIRTLVAEQMGLPLNAVLRVEIANAGITRLRLQEDVNGRPAPSLVFHARHRL